MYNSLVIFAKKGIFLKTFIGRLISTSDLLEITEPVSEVFRPLHLANCNKMDQNAYFQFLMKKNSKIGEFTNIFCQKNFNHTIQQRSSILNEKKHCIIKNFNFFLSSKLSRILAKFTEKMKKN